MQVICHGERLSWWEQQGRSRFQIMLKLRPSYGWRWLEVKVGRLWWYIQWRHDE